jgi:hypothetical protein
MNLETRPRKYLHGDTFFKFWEKYLTNKVWREDELFKIYIDFPYCMSNCEYCIWKTSPYQTSKEQVAIYEAAMVKLIQSFKPLFPLQPIHEIYFGGGTPTLWSEAAINQIIEAIPPYYESALRSIEIHPFNLTTEKIAFIINTMKANRVSIGIQSFNMESNRKQHRICCDFNRLIESVREFQKHKIHVNIDLVALFNGEEEKDWEIFKDDLKIVSEIVKPDSFFCVVNYYAKHYFDASYRLREILIDFIKNDSNYIFEHDECYALDRQKVIDFAKRSHILITPEYYEIVKKRKDHDFTIDIVNDLAFGGTDYHQVSSMTTERDGFNSFYSFDMNKWVFYRFETDDLSVFDPDADL